MAARIAIVEDEPAIRENYAEALRRQGYVVHGYASRPAALEAFGAALPDLVIIDVQLGDEPEGGFELCRALRARSTMLPIMFLTARDDDIDAISGLRLGADDYLTKDLSLAHLGARVAALLRRARAASDAQAGESARLERGELELDSERLTARWRGDPVPLSLTEFWLVHALARRPGQVKSRDQLMQAANTVLDDSTITSHVKRIRRKFEQLDGAFDRIETVYGAGYRWRESAGGA